MNLEILKKLNLQECIELVRVMNASISDPMYVWDLENDKIYFTRIISEDFVLQRKESIGFEIQEMLNVCSRLTVMKDRNIVGELRDDDLSQDNIMKTIAGGKNE